MWVHEKVLPIVVSVTVLSVATAILWYAKLAEVDSQQLVYFYLLPVVLIAYLYNGRVALWCTGLAVIGADYFLQDPIYSMYNSNPLEYGDLVFFAVLAALAIKCTRNLMRPSSRNMRRLPFRMPSKTET